MRATKAKIELVARIIAKSHGFVVDPKAEKPLALLDMAETRPGVPANPRARAWVDTARQIVSAL